MIRRNRRGPHEHAIDTSGGRRAGWEGARCESRLLTATGKTWYRAGRMKLFRLRHTVVPACLFILGCGAVASNIRPDEPKIPAALGEKTCSLVGGYAEPLVVDWPSHERADLAEAMHDGVPVVAYDCNSLRLLRGCSVDGSYAFLNVPRDDQVMQLLDSEEVHANLPGGFLAAELSSELQRGSSVDIATVLVGKKRTTVTEVPRTILRGGEACAGATHFLKGAFVGAFATKIHTEGKAETTVSIFASASGGSKKTNEHRAGKLAACDQLSAIGATNDCDAVMRIELVALDQPILKQSAEGEGAGLDVSKVISPCPANLVFAQGKCTRSDGGAHLCKDGDAADCRGQCRDGDPLSCNNLGVMHFRGTGVTQDTLFAGAMFQQGCDGKVAIACRNLGMVYTQGKGIAADPVRAAGLYKQACDGDDIAGCFLLAQATVLGQGLTQDPKRGATLMQKACDGGSPTACMELAVMYGNGMGVPKDPLRQVLLYQRACDGWSMVCTILGIFYETGIGGPKDLVRAKASYKQACDGGERTGCERLKNMDTQPFSGEELAAWTRMQMPGAKGAAADSSGDEDANDDGEPIKLMGLIRFEAQRAALGSANNKTLDDLVSYLQLNRGLTKVRIEAHTNNDGDPAVNLALSGRRAVAVKKYLVAQGIDAARLLAIGFGQAKPIADNTTAEGRAKNVRVQLFAVERDGKKLSRDPTAGGKPFD